MKTITSREKIHDLLTRAVSEAIVKDHLETALKSGRRLRIKFGIDPTAPDIHLGHAVPLMKLRQFQDLGHRAVLIIGDFTARIGDPSGRTEARKPLSDAVIRKNLKNYLAQAGKIINIKKAEIHYNSEWFGKMKAAELHDLMSRVTVQQILKRQDFRERIKKDQDIMTNEMMYPLFQGYDSVKVRADVEMGGQDQILNMLMGRRIQRSFDMPEQDILATWLIEGTDGIKKMSKSFGNYIGVDEKPRSMFGNIMSIPDSLIIKYFLALTTISDKDIAKIEIELKSRKSNPRDAKIKLAHEIVKIYHGLKKAEEAAHEFHKIFIDKELPGKMPAVSLKAGAYSIIDLLVSSGLAASKSEARRLVEQGAVKIDSGTIKDIKAELKISGSVIVQSGKRNFRKIIVK